MHRFKSVCLAVGLASALGSSLVPSVARAQAQGVPAPATGVQAPGFNSKPLLVAPIGGDDAREVVLIDVSIAPGASSPVHTHPGDCYGTVIEGTIELRIDGQEPRRIAAGQSYHGPRGTIHQFGNVGTTPVHMVNVLVVEKGKPRTVTQPPAQK